MEKKVTVRNRRNGAESEMTEKEWKELQANPNYNGTFKIVEEKKVPEPKEVTELKTKKAEKPAAKEVAAEPAIAEQSEAKTEDNGK